jgi:hypothetical protein
MVIGLFLPPDPALISDCALDRKSNAYNKSTSVIPLFILIRPFDYPAKARCRATVYSFTITVSDVEFAALVYPAGVVTEIAVVPTPAGVN